MKVSFYDGPIPSYWLAKLDVYPGVPQASPEMPASGDLKLGDCSMTPLPHRKIDPVPNGNDWGHYMTSYMMYILSKFEIIVLMLEIIFVND